MEFELKITFKDWLMILVLAIVFSTLLSVIIYLMIGFPVWQSFIIGTILGIYLGGLSFTFIHLTNNQLLPKLRNIHQFWWWFIAGIASFLAGSFGFYLAYLTVHFLNLSIPSTIKKYVTLFSIIVGILNYLVGLIIFLFIQMRNRREKLLSKILYLRNIFYLRMVESHFLSNLINNIIELMHKDLDKAETALIQLAKYLRQIIGENDLITLSQELELVGNYIALQKIRYCDLINLEIQILNEESLALMIPKFSIQSLVENAIKHGFTGKPLTVFVREVSDRENLILEIENDGDVLKEFRPGKGLTLLKERLEVLLKGNLRIVSNNPVRFQLIIPKFPEKEENLGKPKNRFKNLEEKACLKKF